MREKRGGKKECDLWLLLAHALALMIFSGCALNYEGSKKSVSGLSNTIYGQLLDQDGKPVVGEMVSAEWADREGVIHQVQTRTLSKGEAQALGDDSLEGYFVFAQGRITAQQNTTIMIKSQPRYSVLRFSATGSELDVGTMTVLRAVSPLKQADAQDVVTVVSSEQKAEEISPVVAIAVEDNKGNPLRAEIRMLSENETRRMGSDAPGGVLAGPRDGSSPSAAQKWSSIHASWRISGGISEEASLRILSKEQAQILGDSRMEGWILVDNPSEGKRGTLTISVDEVISSSEPTKERSLSLGQKENKDPSEDADSADERKKIALWPFLAGIALIVSCLLLFSRKSAKRSEWMFFRKEAKSVEGTTVQDIMTKEVITIKDDAPLLDAVDLMMDHHINAVVVMQGRSVRGIITEGDFLEKVYFALDAKESKAREVMTTRILTLSPFTSLLDALHLMLNHDLRKLPVVKNERLVGIVTATDIVRSLSGFLEREPTLRDTHAKETVDMRALREIPLCENEDSLWKVVETLKKAKMGFAIITSKEEIARGKVAVESAGIITIKDLLEEFHKNPGRMSALKAVHVKRAPLWTISAEKTIAEATAFMAEHHIRRLPLEAHGKIVGVVGQKGVLEAFLESIDKAQKVVKGLAHRHQKRPK